MKSHFDTWSENRVARGSLPTAPDANNDSIACEGFEYGGIQSGAGGDQYNEDLMDAGGPTSSPVSVMLDEGSPAEYPVKLDALNKKTEQYCVVMQTLATPPKLQTEWVRDGGVAS